MYINKKSIFAAAAIIVLAVVVVAVLTSNKGPSVNTEVLHAAYPLYAQGVTWGDEVPLSVPPHVATNPTDQTIVGNVVSSMLSATTTDIAGLAEPFRMYYDTLLVNKGWSITPKYQADGAGSSVWGYTKGTDVLILSYNSYFLDQTENAPVQCPCKVQFFILGGKLQ